MAKKQPTSHLTFLGDPHSGRDEMNLAGHPFALLQTPKRQNDNSISYDWKRTISGREVAASWLVEGSAKFGLPGPEEELLYLVLLQLTREAAEEAGTGRDWPLTVKFSRGDLLKRLGWHRNAQHYTALELAFNRLKSVSITANYAFYDARTQSPLKFATFGIINEAVIQHEPKGRKGQMQMPLSHFEWNTILHTSFIAGNVRSLALDFAISLQHPTSRRLFRLLELLRYASKPPRPQLSMGLFKLRDRLGMTPYAYPSQIAQKLAPAVKELVERGYLSGMSLEKDKNDDAMAVFRFYNALSPHRAATPQASSMPAPGPQPAPATAQAVRDVPSFAGLLPDFGAPWPGEFDDPAGAALDAFFEALPQAERDDIDARAHAALPSFLRDNPRLRGAISQMTRERRRETRARYPAAIGSNEST